MGADKGESESGALRSIGGSPEGRVQVKKVRKDGWTAKRRTLFLDRLAATCCVGEALTATGMAASSLYRLRKRDPDFAAAWAEAVAAHFDDVELALVRLARDALQDHGADNVEALAEARARAMANPSFALDLLKMHRAGEARERGGGERRRIGGRVAVADKNEVAEEIMTLVRAMHKAEAKAR